MTRLELPFGTIPLFTSSLILENIQTMQMRQTIQIKTKRGFLLSAFAGDSITREVQKNGEYDGNTLDSLSTVLSEIQPDLSLDVGANIGNHALVITKYSKKLIAFEPIEFIFNLLKKNLQQNHGHRADAVNFGLSDKTAECEIVIPSNGNLGSSSIETRSVEGERYQIRTIIGDDYLTQHYPESKVDFIKIDVEGHEVSVIRGLLKTICKHQPLVLLEWNSKYVRQIFIETKMLEEIFVGYMCYSLSYTSNKKVHPKGLYGGARRIFYKLFKNAWCLSNFDPHMRYSNVYLVPARYQQVFAEFRFLSR